MVNPGTLYRLSAWIMVRGTIIGDAGASVAVLGSAQIAGNFTSTGGKWHYVELYGRTRADQSALAVIAQLGFGGNSAAGIALFDDVALEEAAALPGGTPAIDFGANETPGSMRLVGEGKGAAGVDLMATAPTQWSMPWGAVLALAIVAAATTLFNGGVLLRALQPRAPRRRSASGPSPQRTTRKRRSRERPAREPRPSKVDVS